MAMMRQVLTSVAKDTAPSPGGQHPLREQTIQAIRQCLYVISRREQELAEVEGYQHRLRPKYSDDPNLSQIVPIETLINK